MREIDAAKTALLPTVEKAASGVTYRHSRKYRQMVNSSVDAAAEDYIHLRLAEQYLIRAEARAQQNKLTGNDGAITD